MGDSTMRKFLCVFLALIICVCSTTTAFAEGSIIKKDFSRMNTKELQEIFELVIDSIDFYYKLRMSDNNKLSELMKKQTEDKETLDNGVLKSLNTTKQLIPDTFSNDIKEYLAAKLFCETYSLALTDTHENFIDSDYEIDSWKVIDNYLVCKVNTTINFKYSDCLNSSVIADQIQIVIENADNPVIIDWYCSDPSSFDSCVRTYELDMYEKENWKKNIDKGTFREKLLYKCADIVACNSYLYNSDIDTKEIGSEQQNDLGFTGNIPISPAMASATSVPFDNWMSARIRAWYYANYILYHCPTAPIAYSSGYSYVRFETIPGAYDCTNFVSHCLLAGRFSMKSGTHLGSDGWFFNSMNSRSSTWSSVNQLYNFIKSNTSSNGPKCKTYTAVTNKAKVTGYSGSKKPQAGDILQIKFNSPGSYAYPNFGHSTIISSIDSNNFIHISYRTSSSSYKSNVRLIDCFPPAPNTTNGSGKNLYRVSNYSVPPESHNNLVVFQRFYAEY